jgi:quercetin dioxygenase-like cupin family protein
MHNPPDRSSVEPDWARRGYSFGIWVDPPGQEWRDFVHATDELVMLVEGELELTCDGTTYRLTPGRVLVIPPNAPHSGRALTACRVLDVFAPVRDDYR